MDNIFDNDDITDSESSEDENEDFFSNNDETFMSMANKKEYEKNRNSLFTPNIVKKKIVVDSHNYYQGEDGFSTSNFDVIFDYERKPGSGSTSLVTTNYDIYKDVIGFRLLKTTIRTPPYNVNTTNNIIRYKTSKDGDTIHSVTINPGQYDIDDLRSVFQKHEGVTINNVVINDINKKFTQFTTYSDSSINPNVTTHSGTFTLSFFNINSQIMNLPDSEVNSSVKGIKFQMDYSGDNTGARETVTILWDYDNITRGAARIFGFMPRSKTSVYLDTGSSVSSLYSDRIIDISSHFVDLVIPEIPSITCKRNSSGREIIDRIQLKAGHGEYLHHRSIYEGKQPIYFNPIKLHRLNIQLWAVNNELYDTNNSDVSFEFEITMLKNISLLR